MKQILRIGFEQLCITCIIGILPEERIHPQPILVSLNVQLAHQDAFVDYRTLAEMASQLAQKSHFFLEEYAKALCQAILQDPLINGLKVRIQKPAAITSSQGAFVEMEAWRQ